jgi:molybdate transport repressor ModE-like protein
MKFCGLERFAVFLAVATGGGLAAGARSLRVSPVTVWRHVAELEQVLQVRLFEDRKSGYVLSAGGERLLETARRIEGEVFRARRAISGAVECLEGEVRVTAPELLANKLLPANLHRVREPHPELRIELITGTPTAGLSRHETDIAMRFDGTPHGDFMIDRRVAVGFGIYAARSYLGRHGKPDALNRFDGYRLIAFDDSAGHVAPERWLYRGGKGAKISFRSNSLSARIAAAKAGHGCVLLPALIGDAEPGLWPVFSAKDVGSLDLFLFVNGRLRNSPRVEAVVRFIVDVLDTSKEALVGWQREGAA